MTDYGADAEPNIANIRQVAFGYFLAPLSNLKVDQFTIHDSAACFTLVRFHGKTRLKVLVNPNDLPQLP